jgi:Tfp pilus assembly protein PilX
MNTTIPEKTRSSRLKVTFSRRPSSCARARADQHNQRGATLLVVLIMLVVLTLFAVQAINLSTINARVVGNMQQRVVAESVAQTAIETTLNSINNFGYTGRSASVSVTAPTGLTVTVGNRVCINAQAASGYSAAVALVPEDTFWDVPVSVTDSITGSATTMHQGVKIRMLAGNCPA